MSIHNLPRNSIPVSSLIPLFERFSENTDMLSCLESLCRDLPDPTQNSLLEHFIKIQRVIMKDFQELLPSDQIHPNHRDMY